MDAAPDLKRAGGIVVLMLDVKLRPDEPVQAGVIPEWRGRQVGPDDFPGVQGLGH